MNPSNGLMDQIMEMKRRCLLADQRLMDELKLSQSELLFFSSLGQCQGISSPELARGMGLSLSRISRVVDKLVVNGYLERNTDPADRRAIQLCLTPKGKSIRGKIDRVRNECEAKLLEIIPSEELARFEGLLSKIIGHL